MSIFIPLVSEPIEHISDMIDTSENNLIFLTGVAGSGKTMVLNYLTSGRKGTTKKYIDVSPNYYELLLHTDSIIYKLYQTCLVLEKALLFIIKNYPQVAIHFEKFYFFMEDIIQHIKIMNTIGVTDADQYLKDITSENLINIFLDLKERYLKNINLTMIFDSFDKIAGDYPTYQQHIYSLLKDRLNILISVSDPKVIENPTLLDANSDIINVSYSTDLEIVKQILDRSLMNEEVRFNRLDLRYRLRFILSDEAIKRLIIETKGNINDMNKAIYFLYNEIVLHSEIDYEKVLFQFVQDEINYNPNIKGYAKPKRCLRIV